MIGLAYMAASQVIFYAAVALYLRYWHGPAWQYALLVLPMTVANTTLFFAGLKLSSGGVWGAQAMVWLTALVLPLAALSWGTGHFPGARALGAVGLCLAGVALAVWR